MYYYYYKFWCLALCLLPIITIMLVGGPFFVLTIPGTITMN